MSRPSLAAVRGLIYIDPSQVFNRWLIPTYQTAFRWTGNRVDSEDATAWTLDEVASDLRLPELVHVVDDQVADTALEAITRHWTQRYRVAPDRRCEIYSAEAAMADRHRTLDALFEGLSAEMRLVLVLRFLRKRNLHAIATQLRVRRDLARGRMIAALTRVAEQLGFQAESHESDQADHVSAYVDDIVRRRAPVRFDVLPEAWPPVLGANQIQAAIAGNSLPEHRFVRSLQERLFSRATSPCRWSA